MVPRQEYQQLLQHQHFHPHPHPQRAHSSNSTKRSTRSYSSSFEADDERSSSNDDDSMGPGDLASGFRDGPSQYEGEDTRLTSRKELNGWYAYAFAAEVYVICGMGEFAFLYIIAFK